MKSYKPFIVIAFLAILGVSCSKEDNNSKPKLKIVKYITADITEPATWYADTLYVINATSINIEAPLTIKPGTIVKIEQFGLNFTETGSLTAEGTEKEPIIFTSAYDDSYGGDTDNDQGIMRPDPSDWQNITFEQANTDFKMEYCHILYGSGILIQSATAGTINHCTFAHNTFPLSGMLKEDITLGAAALTILKSYGDFTVKNCTFFDNSIPLAISQFMDADSSNLFSYNEETNAFNGIYIIPADSAYTDEHKMDIQLNENEVPYIMLDNYTIKSGVTLSFGNNAVVKCLKDVKILIESGGTINSNNHSIIYTSYTDDTNGGDTNGDSNYTYPKKGDWQGIFEESKSGWKNESYIFYDAAH